MLSLPTLHWMEEVAHGNREAWLRVEQITQRLEYWMEEVRSRI